MRNLNEDTGAVARQRIGADGTAMLKVYENLQSVFDDLMRFGTLQVGNEADTAGIFLKRRVVQSLAHRPAGRVDHLIVGGKLNTAFLQLAANGSLEEPTLKALERAGVIAGGGAPAPIRPFVHPVPGARHRATAQGPFRLADVARAIASQRRVERRLSKGSLRSVLGEFSRLSNACSTSELAEGGGAARAVRAFELARLLRSPANRCLPRSIALANCLASHGVTAQVVLAVKLAPFAAHCWTQLGDTVLNDTPEEVARYTPILVV